MNSDNYIKFMCKYLDSNLDAKLWLCAYAAYVHAIDDIIDNEIPKDRETKEFMLKTFEFAAVVYSNHFYQQNIAILYPLVKMTSNSYMDSVILEGENKPWMKNYADILRSNGNDVILAVIEIVAGYDVRRKASLELREISYLTHHDETGKPI